MNYFAGTLVSFALGGALSVSAYAQPSPRVMKDQLMEQVAGICMNPNATFPKPVPEEKKVAFASWCACVQAAIDDIPTERLEQASRDTSDEYAKYRSDPRGFIPVAPYSLIRISKSCVK